MTKPPQVSVPRRAARGEVVLVRAKLRHPMETGWRKDASGATVPRKRIHGFQCAFNGLEVFRAVLHAGVSSDPYLAFNVVASESGDFERKLVNRFSRGSSRVSALAVRRHLLPNLPLT